MELAELVGRGLWAIVGNVGSARQNSPDMDAALAAQEEQHPGSTDGLSADRELANVLQKREGLRDVSEAKLIGEIEKCLERGGGATTLHQRGPLAQVAAYMTTSDQQPPVAVAPLRTTGDGDCFFHAVFGARSADEGDGSGDGEGEFRSESAHRMRREWRDFLGRFRCLGDGRMPPALRDRLKVVLTLFLSEPTPFTGRSAQTEKTFAEAKENVEFCKGKAEYLASRIAERCESDDSFKEVIWNVIRSEREETGPEVFGNRPLLVNRILSNLKECALKMDPDMAFDENYNQERIYDECLNNPDVYKNYLQAITSQKYYVFFEEIPILASLANVRITIYRENGYFCDHFEPNSDLLGSYKPNESIWGKKREAAIYYDSRMKHFSRADVLSKEADSAPVARQPRDAIRSDEADPTPFSTAVSVDLDLKLGRANFAEALTPAPFDAARLQQDALPSAHVLAHFANLVYQSESAYGQLPAGWQLLTTASNKHKTNSYVGAAFWHADARHLVVAHRGTNDAGAVCANVYGVIWNRFPARLSSAVTFVHAVVEAATARLGTCWGLSLTGHSLGGWLAQATCFSAAHLRRRGAHFCQAPCHVHAHCVAFDSPGCRPMLEKLRAEYDLRYGGAIALEALDITTYLSAPNRVNTYRSHAGTLYRLFPDLSRMNAWQKHSAWYTKATHDMDKIAAAFDPRTGTVFTDESGQLKLFRVKDWPLSGLERSDEYIRFFEAARFLNEYHPKPLDTHIPWPGTSTLRYRTVPFDANTCNCSVFSPRERLLLKSWKTLKDTKAPLRTIKSFVDTHGLQAFATGGILPYFEIDLEKDTVRCASLRTLINRSKQLMRWVGDELLKALKDELSDRPSAVEAMYLLESQTFLRNVVQLKADFEDAFGLEAFIESRVRQVLILSSDDIKFDVARTYNVYKRITQATQSRGSRVAAGILVMEWQQILNLLTSLEDHSVLFKCSEKFGHVIIAYPSQTDLSLESKTVLLSMMTEVRNRYSKKIVFVTHKTCKLNSFVFEHFSKIGTTVTKYDLKPILFSDICQNSQLELLNKSVLRINGRDFSLGALLNIDETNPSSKKLDNTISGNILKDLVSAGTNVATIENEVPESYEQQVPFAKIGKETPLEDSILFIVNPKALLRNLKKPIKIFISGIEEHDLYEYLHSICANRELVEKVKNAMDTYVIRNTEKENIFEKYAEYCRDNRGERIYWLEMKAPNPVWQMVYDSDFYIPRQFFGRVTIKMEFFVNFSEGGDKKDSFIISNCTKKEIREFLVTRGWGNENVAIEKGSFITISSEDTANTIFESKRKQTDLTMHFLRWDRDGKQLEWVKSCGSLTNIAPFALYDSAPVDEGAFSRGGERLVLLCGDPGAGKSTTVCSLARRLPTAWVIHKELKDIQSPTQVTSEMDLEAVVTFLLQGTAYSSNPLTAVILKECLSYSCAVSVLVILDGFDEIKCDTDSVLDGDEPKRNKDTRGRVINLVRFLLDRTTANVWITSRQYWGRKLENAFSRFATKLQYLPEKLQRQFLKNFWESSLAVELKEYGLPEETILDQYISDLFSETKAMLGNEISSLMGVPLQMRMIAEVAQPDEELFSNPSLLPSAIALHISNPHNLYQRFSESKYHIYYEKTGLLAGLTDGNRKWFLEMFNQKHIDLAFRVLFPHDVNLLAGGYANRLGDEGTEDEEVELHRLGLVRTDLNQGPDFMHRTFAEYFAALQIYQWLSRPATLPGEHPRVEEFVLSQVLLRPEYRTVRLFVDAHLQLRGPAEDACRAFVQRCWELWQGGGSCRRQLQGGAGGETALHVACREGRAQLTELLLGVAHCERSDPARGHSSTDTFVAARDADGRSALCVAAKHADDKLLASFLHAVDRAPESAQYEILLSALCRTADRAEDDVREALERHGGEVARRLGALIDSRRATTLELRRRLQAAAEEDDADAARRVALECPDPRARSYVLATALMEGRGEAELATALHEAARAGAPTVTAELLAQRVPLEARDALGQTPLLLAARTGHHEVLRLLLAAGADAEARDRYRMSATAWAAYGGHVSALRLLLDAGADARAPDRNGIDPFHHAAKRGRVEAMHELLAHAAAQVHVDRADRFGATPLASAVRMGEAESVRALLRAGADPALRDRHGLCAAQRVPKRGPWTAVVLLAAHGGARHPHVAVDLVARAAAANQWETMERLLALAPPDANFSVLDGDGAWARALRRANKVDLLEAVVRRGADPGAHGAWLRERLLLQVAGGASRDAVYRLLCAGHARLLCDFLVETPRAADHVFDACEELYAKRVPLPGRASAAVHRLLVELRLRAPVASQAQPALGLEQVRACADIVCAAARDLHRDFSGDRAADGFFVYTAFAVARYVHVLKRFLKSTYGALPWNELEFYLVSFLASLLKPADADETCTLLLDKHSVIHHLVNFANKLSEVKDKLTVEDITGKGKLARRQEMVENIISVNPEFESLICEYDFLKNIYSLKRIDYYLKLATSVDLQEDPLVGKLVIERALQVLGESLKNTPESPNVSDDVHKLLKESAPRQAKEVVTSLRDSLSHADTLTRKTELEGGKNVEFFQDVQNDLKKMGLNLNDILYRKKIEIFQYFLRKIVSSSSDEQIDNLTERLRSSGIEKSNFMDFRSKEMGKLRKIITEFKTGMDNEDPEIDEFINSIRDVIDTEEDRLYKIAETLQSKIHMSQCILKLSSNIQTKKTFALTILHLLENKESRLKEIPRMLQNFSTSYVRKKLTPLLIHRFVRLYSVIEFEINRIQGIDEIKSHLDEKEVSEYNYKKEVLEIHEMLKNSLTKEKEKEKFDREIFNRIKLHEAKNKLTVYFSEMLSPTQEIMPEDEFNSLVPLLNQPKRQKELKDYYESKDYGQCLAVVRSVSDSYGKLVKILGEINIFSVDKYVAALKAFFSYDKSLKSQIDGAIERTAKQSLEARVGAFYEGRLALLRGLVDGEEDEDLGDVMRAVVDRLCATGREASAEGVKTQEEEKEQAEEKTRTEGSELPECRNSSIERIEETKSKIQAGDDLHAKQTRLAVAGGSETGAEAAGAKRQRAAAVEMLLLELLEMLESRQLLGDERAFLLQAAPALAGKALRNYLAHGDALADLLPSARPAASVAAHARLLLALGARAVRGGATVAPGRGVDVAEAWARHARLSALARTQADYLRAVAAGRAVDAVAAVEASADPRGTTLDGRSALHCAVRADSLEAVREGLPPARHLALDLPELLSVAAAGGAVRALQALCRDALFPGLRLDLDLSLPYFDAEGLVRRAACGDHAAAAAWLLCRLEAAGQGARAARAARQALLDTARAGATATLRELLDHVGDPDDPGAHEAVRVAFGSAVVEGNPDTVRLLCQRGAPAAGQILGDARMGPLHVAAFLGNARMLEVLLESAGAEAAALPSGDGRVPLELALCEGHEEAALLLLNTPMPPHILHLTDAGGATLLHLAADSGLEGPVRALLQRLPPDALDAVDAHGRTALFLAARGAHEGAARALLQANADAAAPCTQEGLTALHAAARCGALAVVHDVLRHCPQVLETPTADGARALHLAARSGHVHVVRALLEAGAKPDVAMDNGCTPLHDAAKAGDEAVVRALLSAGHPADAEDARGLTALHEAAAHRRTNAARALLEGGARADAVAPAAGLNVTPLLLAAGLGDAALVRLLLEAGADPLDGDPAQQRMSAVVASAQRGETAVLRLLLGWPSRLPPDAQRRVLCAALQAAAAAGHVDAVRRLAAACPDAVHDARFHRIALPRDAAPNHDHDTGLTSNHDLDIHLKRNPDQALDTDPNRNHDADPDPNPNHDDDDDDNGGPNENHDPDSNDIVDVPEPNRDLDTVSNAKCSLDILDDSKNYYDGHELTELRDEKVFPELNTPLANASSSGYEDVVNALLEAGADPLQGSPIVPAALNGHRAVVARLLRAGAPAEEAALLAATEGDHRDIVQLLLEHGADPSACRGGADGERLSALFIAIQLDHEELAVQLVAAGARVDERGAKGATALHLAAEKGLTALVRELVRAGAPLHVLADCGTEPVRSATWMGHVDAALALVRAETEPERRRAVAHKELFVAAVRDHAPLAAALAQEAGPELLCAPLPESGGRCPLHEAAERGSVRAGEVLARAWAGAALGVPGAQGATALHIAARRGDLPFVNMLLRAGAPVDARMALQSTPLHWAALGGHEEVAKALLAAGATPAPRDASRTTPLMLTKCARTARALLHAGADPCAADADGNAPLHAATLSGSVDVVEELLRAGALPAQRNAEDRTPLHAAAQAGHVALARTLLSADPGLRRDRDTHGWTALHFAAAHRRVEMVRLLLEAGADCDDLEAREVLGATPLLLAVQGVGGGAAEGGAPGAAATARLLLEAGARVDCSDADGQTPLAAALRCPDPDADLVAALLQAGGEEYGPEGVPFFFEMCLRMELETDPDRVERLKFIAALLLSVSDDDTPHKWAQEMEDREHNGTS